MSRFAGTCPVFEGAVLESQSNPKMFRISKIVPFGENYENYSNLLEFGAKCDMSQIGTKCLG